MFKDRKHNRKLGGVLIPLGHLGLVNSAASYQQTLDAQNAQNV